MSIKNDLSATEELVPFVIYDNKNTVDINTSRRKKELIMAPVTCYWICLSFCALHSMCNAATCWQKQGTVSRWNVVYRVNKRRCLTSVNLKKKQKQHASLLMYRCGKEATYKLLNVRWNVRCLILPGANCNCRERHGIIAVLASERHSTLLTPHSCHNSLGSNKQRDRFVFQLFHFSWAKSFMLQLSFYLRNVKCQVKFEMFNYSTSQTLALNFVS